MTDYTGPLILAILTIVMAIGVKKLQAFVEEQELAELNAKRQNRPSGLNTTIIDGFLGNDDAILLKKLQNQNAWEKCADLRPRYWDGQSEPKNLWEGLAKKIWITRPEFDQAVGFEYWCNIIKAGQDLHWHIDKDETAMTESHELVTPLHGAVYYGYNHDNEFTGGKLWTVDAQVDNNPFEYEGVRRKEVIEYSADFDRLIFFNASLWHKVSDVKSGKRYTFAVNALRVAPRDVLRMQAKTIKD